MFWSGAVIKSFLSRAGGGEMILLNRLIKYSGVLGFAGIAVAFYTGATEGDFRIHKASAVVGVAFMLAHGGLIWYRGWRIKRQQAAARAAQPAASQGGVK